jgi:hypothetical protein
VAADDVGETTLLCGREAAQGQGHGEGQAPGIQALFEFGGQPPRQQQPPFHPGLLVPQELGDGTGRQFVLLDQRGHDARLVHRATCLGRRVGLEQAGLAGDARDRLQHHRDLTQAIRPPLRQTLETVEDFEVPVVSRRHPQRQGRQVAVLVRAPAAQRSQRGTEPLDGNLQHQFHDASSAMGKIWYSG